MYSKYVVNLSISSYFRYLDISCWNWQFWENSILLEIRVLQDIRHHKTFWKFFENMSHRLEDIRHFPLRKKCVSHFSLFLSIFRCFFSVFRYQSQFSRQSWESVFSCFFWDEMVCRGLPWNNIIVQIQ